MRSRYYVVIGRSHPELPGTSKAWLLEVKIPGCNLAPPGGNCSAWIKNQMGMIMHVMDARTSRIGTVVPRISGFIDANYFCLVQKKIILENNPQSPWENENFSVLPFLNSGSIDNRSYSPVRLYLNLYKHQAHCCKM